MGTKLLANICSSRGVADKLPKGKARLHIFTCTAVFLLHFLCVSVQSWLIHTHSKTLSTVQQPEAPQWTRPHLEPTIKAGDPEDLCEVHSDDVEATGSPLSQESDHHLQKLLTEGWRLVLLSEQWECYFSSHAEARRRRIPNAPVTVLLLQRVFKQQLNCAALHSRTASHLHPRTETITHLTQAHTPRATSLVKVAGGAEGWTCVSYRHLLHDTQGLSRHVRATARHLSLHVSKSILTTCSWAVWMD